MVSFCAVNEYHMLNGDNSREGALTVLFFTILFEMCHFLHNYFELFKKNFFVIVTIISLAWIVSSFKDEIIFKYLYIMEQSEAKYITSLGGYMTSFVNDLENTDVFLNGEQFFATYASAQEVVNETFQPSGTDYIIHVLGDKQREDYMKCFKEADFKYVATIKETITPWEYWIQRANWFFYRELYQNWHPVYTNSYEMYWEKNSDTQNNNLTDACTVTVQNIDSAAKKIIVQADSSINGIADVFIDYEVKTNNEASTRLLFQSVLKVQNTGVIYAEDAFYESNYLRNKSKEFIPIRIIDGYGETTLTASPAGSTYLVINETNCSNIYTVTYDFVEVSSITNKEHINSIENEKSLKNMISIILGGKKYVPLDIQSDEQYLYINIPLENEEERLSEDMLLRNNILHIVR